MKMKLTTNAANLPHLLAKYQVFLALLVCTATLGFTAFQISLVFSATPNQAYIAAQKEQQEKIRIKNDTKTLKALRQLRAAGNTAPSQETGKSDPFSF